MVRASDRAFAIPGFLDELEVAMSADVVKRPDFPVGTAHQQLGRPGDTNGSDISDVGQVMRKAHEGPGLRKHLAGFQREKIRAGVGSRGQPVPDDAVLVEGGKQVGTQGRHGGFCERCSCN